jgi:hypothetical protein
VREQNLGKAAKKAKPKMPTRPSVSHGGKRIEIPLLTGPVGGTNPDARKYPVFNAAQDVEIVEYYLGQLAAMPPSAPCRLNWQLQTRKKPAPAGGLPTIFTGHEELYVSPRNGEWYRP